MPSYAKGADAALMESSIPQIFAATAARFPDRNALIVLHQNVRLTWRELHDAVSRLAAGLTALGLDPGDRVGIWSANCAEWVLLQFAAAQAQLILVNINPAYRSHELRYVLQKSGMRAIFLWDKDDRGDYRRILDEAREGQSLELRHTIYFGDATWEVFAALSLLPHRTATVRERLMILPLRQPQQIPTQ